MKSFARILACNAVVALAAAFPGSLVQAEGRGAAKPALSCPCLPCSCVSCACPVSACAPSPAVAATSGGNGDGGTCATKARPSDPAAGVTRTKAAPSCATAGEAALAKAPCAVAGDAAHSGSPFAKATAAGAGTFQTLIAAVKAAGLWETLQGPGPFTLFAPTDEAFAKLPAGTVEALLEDVPRLQAILKHHVVKGRLTAEVLSSFTSAAAPTLQGQTLAIKICPQGGIRVDEARVTKADVSAPNGVIHVVDRVLLPKAEVAETAR